MMKMTISNFYSMEDIFEASPYMASPVQIASLLTTYSLTYSIASGSQIQELFNKVVNEFSKEAIIESIGEMSDDEKEAKAKDWLVEFLNRYDQTKDYYETLLTAYSNNLSKLMDNIVSTNTGEIYFNDTPQNNGSYIGLDYVNNYTKNVNTTSSEFTTKMARIKEIQDGIKEVWHDWLKDFRCLFYERQGGTFYGQ